MSDTTNNTLNFFAIGDNVNNTARYGFVAKKINASLIDDQIQEKGDALNKMGTSIPTPFARLYLFDAAFRQVNAYYNQPSLHKVAFEGVIDNQEKVVPTSYHYLVSECLDMLEFVFKYGGDKRFGILEWDVDVECNVLRKGTPQHQELANALERSFKTTDLGNYNNKIYLFTWNNHIVGGTSPVTLVYTSPNVRRLLQEYDLEKDLTGGCGNVLFDSQSAIPLYKRSKDFRQFMYAYWKRNLANNDNFRKNALFDYIKNCMADYDKSVATEATELVDVKQLKKEGLPITTANISLYHSFNVFHPETCDYIMCPTSDVYQKEDVDGNMTSVSPPAVLIEYGVDGFRYSPRPWSRSTDHIPHLVNRYLSQRMLPGTMFKYPYIAVDDFLDDKLIEMSFAIRNEKFYSGSPYHVKYLLPLKRDFFKFFQVKDIDQMVSLSVNKETEDVTVEIRVPVTGGVVPMRKVYKENDRVKCYDASHTFDLAIFPSYKIALYSDLQGNAVDDNVYNIMLGTTVDDIRLRFYQASHLSKAIEEQALDASVVSETLRTDNSIDKLKTSHIRVNASFDFIEVTVDGHSGLVIPKFQSITSPVQQFTFCVDFGTTNTHLAYAEAPLGTASPIRHSQIKGFDIAMNDCQVMLLNNEKGFGYFTKFNTYFMREFVPMLMGEGTPVSYPMRTSSWEINTQSASLKMFDSMNIGFNYDRELSRDAKLPGKYQTDVKWARDVLAQDRMKEFFKQLLWMMKNKSALNGGGTQFTVVATYPQSMGIADSQKFKTAWRNAAQQLKVQVDLRFEYESVAPYYSFLSTLKFGQPYMNLDIGGGTTDILHVRPKPGQKDQTAIFSAVFAANDIWGDGCSDYIDANSNGFVELYKRSSEYAVLKEGKRQELQSVIKNAASSADIMSYLFAHDVDDDNPTHVSQAIGKNKEMMCVPIVHFSSLMYYVALVIDLAELKLPTTVSFTGMGSKYIQLIATDEEALGRIVSSIFAFYGRQQQNESLTKANVSVRFATSPKLVTAEGGLIMSSQSGAERLIPDTGLCHGYRDEEYGKKVCYKEISNYKQKVLEEFECFVKLFEDKSVIEAFAHAGHPISKKLVNQLKEYAESSFDLMLSKNSDSAYQNFQVESPMFFWPLKETLYQLGKMNIE